MRARRNRGRRSVRANALDSFRDDELERRIWNRCIDLEIRIGDIAVVLGGLHHLLTNRISGILWNPHFYFGHEPFRFRGVRFQIDARGWLAVDGFRGPQGDRVFLLQLGAGGAEAQQKELVDRLSHLAQVILFHRAVGSRLRFEDLERVASQVREVMIRLAELHNRRECALGPSQAHGARGFRRVLYHIRVFDTLHLGGHILKVLGRAIHARKNLGERFRADGERRRAHEQNKCDGWTLARKPWISSWAVWSVSTLRMVLCVLNFALTSCVALATRSLSGTLFSNSGAIKNCPLGSAVTFAGLSRSLKKSCGVAKMKIRISATTRSYCQLARGNAQKIRRKSPRISSSVTNAPIRGPFSRRTHPPPEERDSLPPPALRRNAASVRWARRWRHPAH